MGKKTKAVTPHFDDEEFGALQYEGALRDMEPAQFLRHLFRDFMRQKIARRQEQSQPDLVPVAASNVQAFRASLKARFADAPDSEFQNTQGADE